MKTFKSFINERYDPISNLKEKIDYKDVSYLFNNYNGLLIKSKKAFDNLITQNINWNISYHVFENFPDKAIIIYIYNKTSEWAFIITKEYNELNTPKDYFLFNDDGKPKRNIPKESIKKIYKDREKLFKK